MKTISYRGPWADYETRVAQSEARVSKLEEEVAYWRGLAEEARETASNVRSDLERERKRADDVDQENRRARNIIAQLESELKSAATLSQSEVEEGRRQLTAVEADLNRVQADNALLKNELAKTVQVESIEIKKEFSI